MNKASSIGVGLLSGLAVGAAVGLILAPKSGPETRAMLKEKADTVRGKAGETMNRWRMRKAQSCMSAAEIE